MKNLKETNKNALTITADFDMQERFETLVNNGMDRETALKTVNDAVKIDAFNAIVTKDGVNFPQFIYGVDYEQFDPDNTADPVQVKRLKVNDIFILKPHKNSYKAVISLDLLTIIEAFGVNLLDGELTALDDETLAKLHIYTKYIPALECFKCETRTSNNKLEEQFQEILKYFYGDSAPQAKKTYIKHLAKVYLKANKNGYKAGGALNLLQVIIDHAYDCKTGKQYEVKSGLASHKAPKESKKA